MKVVLPSACKHNTVWNGMLEGAGSAAAIATVVAVTMPEIGCVPARAVSGPEPFLSAEQPVAAVPKGPVRESRGR